MFQSFNVDFFGLFVVFGLACQLCLEVLVFGWERNKRLLNKEIWADFLKTDDRNRRISYGILCAFVAVWIFGFFMFPMETAAALVICGAAMAASLYFTYSGSTSSSTKL